MPVVRVRARVRLLRKEATDTMNTVCAPPLWLVVAVLDEVSVGQFSWISTLRDPWTHGERASKTRTAVADTLCKADSLRLR